MNLHEKNVNKAFAFADELTKRNAAIILIAGRDQSGNVFFAHDDNMPNEVLVKLLLDQAMALKRQGDSKIIHL